MEDWKEIGLGIGGGEEVLEELVGQVVLGLGVGEGVGDIFEERFEVVG